MGEGPEGMGGEGRGKMTWRYHLALRVLRREDRSRREPLFLPSGSQGLSPELRVCTARTAFPEGQVTRPQAELRGQPRSPPPRGRAPKGPSSESPLPEAEANRPQEAAPSRPRPPGLCQEPLSGPERPLPTAQPFPGLDRCVCLVPWGRHSPNTCTPVLSKPWTLPGGLTGGQTLSFFAGIF